MGHLKNHWFETYPVFEKTCHESAAQLLAEADDSILGAGVDFKIEASGSLEVINEVLALICCVGFHQSAELGIPNEGIDGSHMVGADLLHDVLGVPQ